MGAGLHGYNGVNPKVVIKLWNMYVCSRLLFGLESVVLKKKDYTSLNLYHKCFKKHSNCSRANRRRGCIHSQWPAAN